ncbi:SirB2 family protein [soil metagenome]
MCQDAGSRPADLALLFAPLFVSLNPPDPPVNYLAIKHLHITFAVLSGSFFLLRGLWMLADSPMLQRRWVKIVPHVVDTLLLASALVLVFWSGQYPFVQGWLTAKVLALVAYIVLGTVALKRGKTKGVRTVALLAALATFAYIVAVALTRQALIPLQALGLLA